MTIRVRFRNAPAHYLTPESLFARIVATAMSDSVQIVRDSRSTVECEFVTDPSNAFAFAFKHAGNLSARKSARLGRALRRLDPNAALRPNSTAKASFWFTGENVRPPVGDWDGLFSFDLDSLDGRNAYIPLWFETVRALNCSTYSFSKASMTIADALSPRGDQEDGERPGFMCAFIGNMTRWREQALSTFSKIGAVDVYGPSSGRPVPDKFVVASRYRYILCFENDLYPGYVTEKPFEAWASGATPVWWGSDPLGYINESAVLNAAEEGGIHRIADIIVARERDSATPLPQSHAILTRPPDFEPAMALIRRALA
jgi:hypothetical protein